MLAIRACFGAIESLLSIVMPALVAGIHVFLGRSNDKGVDGRDEPGQDSERRFNIIGISSNRWCSTLALLLPCLLPGAAMAQNNASSEGRTFVVKLATATLNDGQHEWMKRFAVAIEKRSGGRIKAELYPASQLGSIPRMIEATQLGSIQIFNAPPEFLVGIDKRFELLSAPGLVESEQHAVKTISDREFAKAFLTVGANKGLIGLSLFIGGPLAYATRAPVRTLDDLKGRKIRVLASPFQIEQMTRLGGTGVPMSLGDVLPALQQGTIDGALSQIGLFTAFRYYDTTKYVNETGQAFAFVLAVASKRWFDTLPADLQAMVLATAEDAATEVNPWEVDFLARQRKAWVENGGELDVLSPADKAQMMAKIGTVGEDIVRTQPELKPLWDLLRTASKRSL
jgi:TRAP-type C4-dicarboxylate transport system substrate-binding protein